MDTSKMSIPFEKNYVPGGRTRPVRDFSDVELEPIYLKALIAQDENPLVLCLLSSLNWTLLTDLRLIHFRGDKASSVKWSEIAGSVADKPNVKVITADKIVQYKLKSGNVFTFECEEGKNSTALQLAASSIFGEILRNEKDPDANAARKRSFHNKLELEKSELCGCYFCKSIFTFDRIEQWVDPNGVTALCPDCGIDCVIGSASGYPITTEFLKRVRNV